MRAKARYYLTIKLDAARNMLEKTTMRIIDVALACGFKSAGHFSSRYLSSFGQMPRESRNSWLVNKMEATVESDRGVGQSRPG